MLNIKPPHMFSVYVPRNKFLGLIVCLLKLFVAKKLGVIEAMNEALGSILFMLRVDLEYIFGFC